MKTFAELSLSPAIQQAIRDLKYETPSAIQAETLPILLGEPTDFIGLAATGTGKTAAFGIPMLERIDVNLRKPQALILCPTRELAIQVAEQIQILGKHLKVKALPIYGGAGYSDQIYGLKAGAQVIVGTPGRVVDHLERGTLKLDSLKTLILDEADEMISMGFKDDLEAVLKAAPKADCNIWLFSATMDREVRRVADKYLKNPKQVQINKKEMLSATVEQIYYITREADKPEVLCKLIDAAVDFYGVVFCQTKVLVADLHRYLTDRGYKSDCLHGDKDQKARERTMQAFRDRRVNILVCTDVAARGIDVKDVTHVINYSIPRELDSYVHRIGRTARSGKSGYAFSLVTKGNWSLINRIEKMTNSRMVEGRVPSMREIAELKTGQVLKKFNEQNSFSRALEVVKSTWASQLESLSREEIVAKFLMMHHADLFDAKKSNTDVGHHALTADEPHREAKRRDREKRESFYQGAGKNRDDKKSPSKNGFFKKKKFGGGGGRFAGKSERGYSR